MINLGDDPFIKKYQGIVLSIVARYSTNKNDYEELVSAGIYGLMLAKKTFKKNKGCKMSTWVYTCARSEIQKAKNSEIMVKISPVTAGKMNIQLVKFTNFLEPRVEENTPCSIMCEEEHQKERNNLYKDVWIHLNRKFNNRERNIILDYFIRNKSIREIDSTYHCNCYKVLSMVKNYIRGIYDSSSSSSSVMAV